MRLGGPAFVSQESKVTEVAPALAFFAGAGLLSLIQMEIRIRLWLYHSESTQKMRWRPWRRNCDSPKSAFNGTPYPA